MVLEQWYIFPKIYLLGIGKIIWKKEKENIFSKMAINTLETG
jgi:hypothetical protein